MAARVQHPCADIKAVACHMPSARRCCSRASWCPVGPHDRLLLKQMPQSLLLPELLPLRRFLRWPLILLWQLIDSGSTWQDLFLSPCGDATRLYGLTTPQSSSFLCNPGPFSGPSPTLRITGWNGPGEVIESNLLLKPVQPRQ